MSIKREANKNKSSTTEQHYHAHSTVQYIYFKVYATQGINTNHMYSEVVAMVMRCRVMLHAMQLCMQ